MCEGLSGLLEDMVWRGAGSNDDDNVDELPDELMSDVGEGRGGWLIAASNTLDVGGGEGLCCEGGSGGGGDKVGSTGIIWS